jgi:hypothetical protein
VQREESEKRLERRRLGEQLRALGESARNCRSSLVRRASTASYAAWPSRRKSRKPARSERAISCETVARVEAWQRRLNGMDACAGAADDFAADEHAGTQMYSFRSDRSSNRSDPSGRVSGRHSSRASGRVSGRLSGVTSRSELGNCTPGRHSSALGQLAPHQEECAQDVVKLAPEHVTVVIDALDGDVVSPGVEPQCVSVIGSYQGQRYR